MKFTTRINLAIFAIILFLVSFIMNFINHEVPRITNIFAFAFAFAVVILILFSLVYKNKKR